MGTTYRVIIEKKRDFPGCPSTEEGTCYGTCDYSTKKIHICGPLFRVDESGQIEDLGHFARSVLRHEIVHAWFYESGQDYFNDEQIVRFIGSTLPNLSRLCSKANLLS